MVYQFMNVYWECVATTATAAATAFRVLSLRLDSYKMDLYQKCSK